ncbi:hypothetical protein [Iningainema tapete]|uniref:Uncharacterized protein n=1 Tax=Iningainema tapete BLCC-T55 TaxID=2748662 RepID=A0A8J6XGN9_9CYAN|nr:hypothetical protein [Iningainema tapete]MBD2775554.1 hypothetical protein [Iningainema tapete BLCC-T55]
MRKTTILTLSLALLGILPVLAQQINPDDFTNTFIGNNNENLGKVQDDFFNYANALQEYLNNNLTRKLQPVEDYASKNAIDASRGNLQIHDPFALEDRVKEYIINNPIPNKFENNQELQTLSASNEINRQIALSAVQGNLGREGQYRLQGKFNDVQSFLERVDKFVDNVKENQNNFLNQLVQQACQVNPTTNVIGTACGSAIQSNLQVQSLIIQGGQAKMMGETLVTTTQLNQAMQYSNLNLANISQQMEDVNRARRVDASVETARLLRATAQVDLLGIGEQDSDGRNQASN